MKKKEMIFKLEEMKENSLFNDEEEKIIISSW